MTILKTLVGSHAHGLANKDSDYDYRGVFIIPTSEILSLRGNPKQVSWIEGKQDDTSWELGHFLNMATHCNPTVLETFLAPVEESTKLGDELRELFPCVWNSRRVRDAFIGYGLNQRKKFLENKDNRAPKYAAAYLRSLYNGYELLTTGTFTVRIADTEVGETCRKFKEGRAKPGEIIQTCLDLQKMVEEAYDKNPSKVTDMDKVDEFLLRARKENW